MRVYHFINKEYGIEDLRRRRLKIATLNELNDSFEFYGVGLSDENIRRGFKKMKDEISLTHGLLCFSKDWHNPVQWSHYADKHRGLCLGLEIPFEVFTESFGSVYYSRKRFKVNPEQLINHRQLDHETLMKLLFTKYVHWKYENEVRSFVTLDEKDTEKNMYFVEFSDKLKLVQVVVGAEASATREDISTALGDLNPIVEVFKARLAFKTFRVVRQRNQKLWA
ncbi:MAG: DUF2971 domain-containing protein [Chloroflexota bacterium]